MITEQRLRFEAKHKVPDGVVWDDSRDMYVPIAHFSVPELQRINNLFKGYQSALEDRQGEAVGKIVEVDDETCGYTRSTHREIEMYDPAFELPLGTEVYASPQPAQTERIAELESELVEAKEDTKRLDYMLLKDAFAVPSKTDSGAIVWQLWNQDEDEEYFVLSGETSFFKTPRAAIDAAMRGNE